MNTTTTAVLALLLASLGCGGAGAASGSAIDIEITSHADRATVEGVFVLAGTADAGPVEVAVDDGPFLVADGIANWSIEIDADEWSLGFHTVQARVISGFDQGLARVSLYCENEPPPSKPPYVPPVPPSPGDPPEAGLMAHWKFDSLIGGITPDASGNGFGASVEGGATTAIGPVGVALNFDGIDDVAYIPDSSSPPPEEIGSLSTGTVAFWVRYDSIYNGGMQADILPVLHFGRAQDSNQQGWDSLEIYIGHGDLLSPGARCIYFTILKDQGLDFCFNTYAALESGTWYHFAISMDTNGHKAYLDGEEVELHYTLGSPSDGSKFFGTIQDQETFELGHGFFGVTGTFWHLDGALDDLRIYDHPLNATEVSALANAGG